MKIKKKVIFLLASLVFIGIAIYYPQHSKDIAQALSILIGNNICGTE